MLTGFKAWAVITVIFWDAPLPAHLRMWPPNGALKSRPYDVAKVGIRWSPRLMLDVLAFTRSCRPEVCILSATLCLQVGVAGIETISVWGSQYHSLQVAVDPSTLRPEVQTVSSPSASRRLTSADMGLVASSTHDGHRFAGLWFGRYTAGALHGSRFASVPVTTGGSRVRANSSVIDGGSTVSRSAMTGVRPNVSCLPWTCPVNLRTCSLAWSQVPVLCCQRCCVSSLRVDRASVAAVRWAASSM